MNHNKYATGTPTAIKLYAATQVVLLIAEKN